MRSFHHHETKIDLLECDLCGKKLKTINNLQHHMLRFHIEKKEFFYCDLCPMKFKKKCFISCHIYSVHKNLVDCKVCGKFMKPINLKFHMDEVHVEKSEKFKCEKCGKYFKARKNFLIHLKVHNKPFKCEKCGKKFQMSSAYKNHLKTHENPDGFECKICGKKSVNPAALKRHLLMIHGPDEVTRRFSCNFCDFRTKNKKSLNYHEKTKHKDGKIVEKIKKSVKCLKCEKKFAKKSQRNLHMEKVHTNVQHECDYCGKIIKKKKSLENHFYKVHSIKIEKIMKSILKCKKCDETFHIWNELRDHTVKCEKN